MVEAGSISDGMDGFLSARCDRTIGGDRLKLLYWDADGLAIWYKRLEEGTFVLPVADGQRAQVGEHGLVLRPAELAMLLDGVDLNHIKRHQRYQRPAGSAASS